MNLVLCGRGGQGVLYATEVLAEGAARMGLEFIASETHGMAQRGGSVVSHLKIGYSSAPLVGAGDADALVSLDKTETYRNLGFLRKGGVCFVNSPEGEALDPRVAKHLERSGIRCFQVDADAIARKRGAPQAGNAAMIGFLSSWPASPLAREALAGAITASSSEKHARTNLQVFEDGCESGARTVWGP